MILSLAPFSSWFHLHLNQLGLYNHGRVDAPLSRFQKMPVQYGHMHLISATLLFAFRFSNNYKQSLAPYARSTQQPSLQLKGFPEQQLLHSVDMELFLLIGGMEEGDLSEPPLQPQSSEYTVIVPNCTSHSWAHKSIKTPYEWSANRGFAGLLRNKQVHV